MSSQLQQPQQSILIVDGDANLRSNLASELKAHGYQVSMATCGNKAFELFPSMEFAVVIADAGMANGNGLELVRIFGERGLTVPVLLLSSDASFSLEEAKKQGAADLLQKPLTSRDVIDRIRRLSGAPGGFKYFINVRRTLVVVSWVGELRAMDADKVKACLAEITKTKAKYVIFNLHGFTGYDAVLAGEIVNFQQGIRDTSAWLILCGMEWTVREQMAQKGLVVEGEILPTLKDALQYVLEIGMK